MSGEAGTKGRRRRMPWPLRSVIAGTAGTAAMSLAYASERRLRQGKEQLDYDDSLVPGKIVVSILHLPDVTDREDAEIGLALRWGYGSAFGLWHGTLRRILPEPWAALVFGATLMTATLSLFPLFGKTPPPWRWPPDVLATSFGTHAAYVVTLAAVDDLLGDADRMRPGRTAVR
ncbi:MAG: hypothetical protein ACRDGK_10595 [Actinomycetota bacterium]